MNKICLGHFTSLKICSNGNLTVTYLLVDRLKAKETKGAEVHVCDFKS